jgi:hypothetical protein
MNTIMFFENISVLEANNMHQFINLDQNHLDATKMHIEPISSLIAQGSKHI